MKGTPFKLKQKLSPSAAKKKATRDLAAAKTPIRRLKKAQNQKIGQNGTTDLHHTGSGIKDEQKKQDALAEASQAIGKEKGGKTRLVD